MLPGRGSTDFSDFTESSVMAHRPQQGVQVQGHQLNMAACFSGILEKVACPVYTRQVTFYKVPEARCHV